MNVNAKRNGLLTPTELAVYDGFGFSEKFARLLNIRGIDTPGKVKDFFNFSINRLHDPFLLKGMQQGVTRIQTAIKNKERILIIGDYDCDGISATAILYKYLLTRRANTRYFLPNRDADGYGLTIELLDKLHKRFQPNLIITVDSGISCYDEIEHAKSLGMDVIVTDHHTIPEKTPDCICINPKFEDQEYPFQDLCGAGVSLKLVQALSQANFNQNQDKSIDARTFGLNTVRDYVDICALATIADIVPLNDENRVITAIGLEMLNKNSSPAVTALAKSSNIFGKLTAQDISFKLGPKINAAGRMGNAKRGLDLLLEKDEIKITEIITSLSNLNTARQKLCNDIFAECDTIIETKGLFQNNIIILYNDTWDGGVLGIVAARITDKFAKPAIILSKSKNIYKGSGRSVGKINIIELLTRHSDVLASFGGHAMAAGLSIVPENITTFVERITSDLANVVGSESTTDKEYDFDLPLDEISPEFVLEIEKLEPTGCGNKRPKFVTEITSVKTQVLQNHPNHVRFVTPQINNVNISFMFFNAAQYLETLAHHSKKQVLFEFQKADFSLNSKTKNAPTTLKAVVKEFYPIVTCDESTALALAINLKSPASDKLFAVHKLTVDRDVFVRYYKVIRKQHKTRTNGLIELYSKARKDDQDINLFQFVFCVAVFTELGIINIKNGYVTINEKVNTELTNSTIYNQLLNQSNM